MLLTTSKAINYMSSPIRSYHITSHHTTRHKSYKSTHVRTHAYSHNQFPSSTSNSNIQASQLPFPLLHLSLLPSFPLHHLNRALFVSGSFPLGILFLGSIHRHIFPVLLHLAPRRPGLRLSRSGSSASASFTWLVCSFSTVVGKQRGKEARKGTHGMSFCIGSHHFT